MSHPRTVAIQPKPTNERSNAGAATHIQAARKQRAAPLVFVNSSDLNAEGEKKGNRKMVKKWAMLNRVRIWLFTLEVMLIKHHAADSP